VKRLVPNIDYCSDKTDDLEKRGQDRPQRILRKRKKEP